MIKVKKVAFPFVAEKGTLLISEPFLNDPNFSRTVILLTEHNPAGSVGFVLNRSMEMTSSELIPEVLAEDFPLYLGGPVEENTLHFIHSRPDLLKESSLCADQIYWGGDMEEVNFYLKTGKAKPSDFKFFLGYSGWAEGQLAAEMNQKSWWTLKADNQLVFNTPINELWSACVKRLGNEYAYLAQSPDLPIWN